jgi:hypothetical protein
MGRQCAPSRTSVGLLFMGPRPRGLAIRVDQIVNGFAVRPDVTPHGAVVLDQGDHNFPQSILMCEKWRNVIAKANSDTSQYHGNVMYVRKCSILTISSLMD